MLGPWEWTPCEHNDGCAAASGAGSIVFYFRAHVRPRAAERTSASYESRAAGNRFRSEVADRRFHTERVDADRLDSIVEAGTLAGPV